MKKARQDIELGVLEIAYREMCGEFIPVLDGRLALSKGSPVDWIAMRRIDARFSPLFAAAIVAIGVE